MVNVLIASPLEPELVAHIAAVDASHTEVVYRPDLLGHPRDPPDHFPPIQRTPEQVGEWARLLSRAEVMLDVDQPASPISSGARRVCVGFSRRARASASGSVVLACLTLRWS